MTVAAPFRVTLWQASKPSQPLIKLVSGVTRDGAVFCAMQWVVWVQDGRPRGKRKWNMWKVEQRASANTWLTIAEGTLKDAKVEQPAEDETATENSPIPTPKASRRRRVGDPGATRQHPIRKDKSRLAQIVADMKTRK